MLLVLLLLLLLLLLLTPVPFRYWAHGFWKIGHESWVHGDNSICCAGSKSDAMQPQLLPPQEWHQVRVHKDPCSCGSFLRESCC